MTVIVPVATAHVGCTTVVVAIAGAVGCALITTLAVGVDGQPDMSVTVKL